MVNKLIRMAAAFEWGRCYALASAYHGKRLPRRLFCHFIGCLAISAVWSFQWGQLDSFTDTYFS